MGIVKRTFSRRKPEIDIEKFKQLTAPPPPPCSMEIVRDAFEERKRLAKKQQEEWDRRMNGGVPLLFPDVNRPITKQCEGCGAPQQIYKCQYCGSIIR